MIKKHKIKKVTVLLLIGMFVLVACTGGRKEKTNPQTEIKEIVEQVKPTINVYIENSGSMDGYVKGVTEFEQAIYSYLSDIKISGVSDRLNLFYINSQTIPIDSIADIDIISDFIEKLEPADFQRRGGNRGNTDISDVIKRVLTDTKPNSISILISDFVFSPSSTKNPEEYMLNQEIGIKNTMATKFQIKNAAFVVYQLHSQFNGIFYYYDKNIGREQGKHYNGSRPFYVWILGDVKNVSELCRQVPKTKFRGQNSIKEFSVMAGNKDVNYAVKPHSGNFDLSRQNTKTEITNLAKDSRSGKVTFSVNIDLANLLLDNSYLTNAANYELNTNDYQLNIKVCPPNEQGYTHTLNFTSGSVHKGVVSVKLKKQKPLPQWIEDANDTDGSQPELGKTYGVKFLIEGVFEGFTQKDKYYTEIQINIK
ncbi:MAG: hypothetical protein LBV69_07315 [Bacteroidales bacterium]|jgi:hypothetical protein|nr:hypothetical protein [Bacteroidales bacterium]